MNPSNSHETRPASKALRLIAILKFVEAAVVIMAGVATLRLLDPSTLEAISSWVQALPRQAIQQFFQKLLDHLSGISHRQVRELGAGAFVLGAIFLAEGIGLWLGKRWAEWLAIVATSLFIPLETLELFRHATAPKALALIVNLLVVVYLIGRIVLERKHAGLSDEVRSRQIAIRPSTHA